MVGAPFEGPGAVYIFLGGPTGLSNKPSQRIAAPEGSETMMFGHGLSRGFDIDHNGLPDLAVGAPNEDKTYIFLAYPVANVVGTITSEPEKILVTKSQITIKACWQLATKTSFNKESGNMKMY